MRTSHETAGASATDRLRELQKRGGPQVASVAAPRGMPATAAAEFDQANRRRERPSASNWDRKIRRPVRPGGGAAPITRVREYFPETLLWQPALITDDKGVADLAVNFADSITTWRLSASRHSQGGASAASTPRSRSSRTSSWTSTCPLA